MTKPVLSTLAAIMLAASSATGTTLFQSGLDTDLGFADVATSADHSIDFGYDYSAAGIAAPPGGSDTVGLRIAANISGPVATGVAVYSNSASYTGQYQVSFDFYISNAASNGTTEFIGGGVGFSVGQGYLDGAVLIGDSDGDSARDFRFYLDEAEQVGLGLNNSDPNLMAAFPGQNGNADGTLGFGWHKMTIDADTDAMSASFDIDGYDFGTLSGVDVGGGFSLVYADLFNSVADPFGDAFGIFDNVTVVAIPEPSATLLLVGGAFLLGFRRRRD